MSLCVFQGRTHVLGILLVDDLCYRLQSLPAEAVFGAFPYLPTPFHLRALIRPGQARYPTAVSPRLV